MLPASPARHKENGEAPLTDAAEGACYTVVSLQERDPKLLLFLHQSGIGPGKNLRVIRHNYDQTVSIELDGVASILGKMAAEAVWLRPC